MSYAPQQAINARYILLEGVSNSKNATLHTSSKNTKGIGYLGGDFPTYVTKVEGVPTQTEIIVFEHEGCELVRKIQTDNTGSWRVDNLNPDLYYDVVCRYTGYKDEIMSNIKPFVG